QLQPKGSDLDEVIATGTTIWTAGTAINPLLFNLPIPAHHRDKNHRPYVWSSLQLLHFPEVFAGGDCATVREQPEPALAQVAYQQGKAIAQNIQALDEGLEPKAAKVQLRGTLLKLGIRNGVANLFNQYQIKGTMGDVLRNATYLELLPTPVHNLKVTTEWLADEIFHRYDLPQSIQSRQALEASPKDGHHIKGILAIAVAFCLGVLSWQILVPRRPYRLPATTPPPELQQPADTTQSFGSTPTP
ncbi:MAG: NAD(P)/FAD-dependent oxidoreductase, partial [Cyanobacteria bacterium P01_H01_bin.121]